jgi:hypothetical protein
MAENVATCYDPHFHLGMRVMTLISAAYGFVTLHACQVIICLDPIDNCDLQRMQYASFTLRSLTEPT